MENKGQKLNHLKCHSSRSSELAKTIIGFVHIHIYCSFLDLSYILQTGKQKNIIFET